MTETRNLYIETFGCQMNERDSEIMTQLMSQAAYLETSRPEEADCIVVNTCSIRGKAAQKAYSLLGGYRRLKKRRPELVIAVAGCVAQQDGENLLKKMPHLDLVIGPQNIYRLPELVESARRQATRTTATELSKDFVIPPFLPQVNGTATNHKRFVTIMQGCNNFCTYCVVPHTRGREVSRKPEDIINEVRHLADHGVREVTLLGQNVNSYGQDRGPAGTTGQIDDFPALLQAVVAVEGIYRVRFTTSHPKDLSPELIDCFAQLNKLCPHFHLPVQSGSDRILARMNRKYSRADYLARVAQLRRVRPDIAITTDLIVGFPGETEADFEATMELVNFVRYDSAFSFKYSDRPNAAAAAFDDKVPEEVKSRRLSLLQQRQEEISREIGRSMVGSTVEVMVEGRSKNSDGQWSGRTPTNRIVNFTGPDSLRPGELVDVYLEEACRHSLRGRMRRAK
ncbi:tRNA (N6-isopentenyl adenosine(37)-C2)-methylthiotransferase MiaB [Desulfurivibrio alkaliphilus]|uniref:tRNA-2-methylthio-N(6)-dimethylallyladenosine synthase n=1 Tax=Desulfurivibrio alkaliphilus (strain DSM 19089 / UNIQEM U267 / AHT2) TaxID=589865 RepID=D6Z1T2_DESAT|nr:tRNA (N6-isopentenyl adenosine(37)-C2)-methylthiotransferase MiaB [Desulfurivibrio alkaliphilus]ADH85507.1 RNA modification enzyme, MiaB family [Desulfurivibrio alkaliphilus AHT 2]